MRYRLLGRSGLRVSEVALGAMTFSDRGLTWGTSPEEARRIFDCFADAGGTFVDTANIYGDAVGGAEGASERVLADLIARDRDHFVLATKYTSSNTTDISRSGNSFQSMRESVDASLRALRVDHLDLLWLHTWDGTTPVEEILRGATQLVTAGKILYFGLSDTPAWVVSYAVAMAEARGWTPPVAVQIEYSLAERTSERELLPMAGALDLGVVAWSPLAAGVLTGKYRKDDPGRRRLDDEAFRALEAPGGTDRDRIAAAVVEVAGELDCPPAHVALAWLRGRPGVVVPILGARTREQIEQNLGCVDLTLDADQEARLDAVSRPTFGFPQSFLDTDMVRRFSVSGHHDQLDNHRALRW